MDGCGSAARWYRVRGPRFPVVSTTDSGEVLAAKFAVVLPHLDERQRRLLLGAEARSLGRGGIARVAAAGVSLPTVTRGVAEVRAGAVLSGPSAKRVEGASR